jgi:hypothetical protein
MKRSEASTQKITAPDEANFGSHYVHVSHVGGDIIDVRISSPGKFRDTALGKLLENINDAIGQEINTIHAKWRAK